MLLILPLFAYLASSSTVVSDVSDVSDSSVEGCHNIVNWVNVPGSLSKISVGSNALLAGVQKSGKIWLHLVDWIAVPGFLAGQIEIGDDGEVWITNPHTFRAVDGMFVNIPEIDMQQISVGNINNIWGRDFYNNAYYYTEDGWVFSGIQLQYVSTASDGTVWGLFNGIPVLLDWSTMIFYEYFSPVTFVQIVAGTESFACGAGNDNSIWCLNTDNFSWVNICGTATWLDLSRDGVLWIVDSTRGGAIYHS